MRVGGVWTRLSVTNLFSHRDRLSGSRRRNFQKESPVGVSHDTFYSLTERQTRVQDWEKRQRFFIRHPLCNVVEKDTWYSPCTPVKDVGKHRDRSVSRNCRALQTALEKWNWDRKVSHTEDHLLRNHSQYSKCK